MIIKDNKKINPIISDQEAKKRKVSLQTADGKNFGEISTSAHSAIRGNYLDRYSPTDDNEKKILDSYKEHVAALTPKAETEESTGRNATLRDLTINSLKRGYVQSLYGQESFKAMTGQKNKKAYYEEKLKSEDYSFIPDAWYEKALSGAMELLGQQVKQWTDNRSLAAGTAAAGAAAVAGQAGPQIALPEEIVTVPGAFFAGIAAGSATANFEIEAGLAYNEMIENGISQKTARKIALGVGAGNAALEAVQLDDLAKSFKILDTQDATKPVAKKLLSYLKDRGMNVASETAQEVAQEAVTITGANLGSKIDKGNWEYNWGEIGQRIGETAVSSAMSFGLLGTGGDVINHGLNRAASAISGKGKKTLGESLLAKHTKNESPALLQTLNDDIPADAAPIVNAKNETNTALSGKRQDPSSVSAIKLTETTETQPSKNTSVITEHQAENPTATADKNFKENLSAHNNAKSDFVSVGDTFKDVKTGNTVTVLGRDAENAKLQIDTGSKIETKEIPNNAIDKSIANGQLERIEIADQSEESIAKNQAYNITVSNLKRKAEDLGLTDSAFYSTLQNVNLYHPSENDKALINDEFRRIFSGNTDSLTASWLDSIANTASSTSPKNIHLTQVGDFYEAYGNEAIDIANKLNLTPTTKNVNGEKVQMVGFPVISLKRYAQALGNDYNISVSDTQSVNGRNMPARTENAVTNEGTTDTGVINHVKEVDGLKLINTEKSTLINGKTLITGVYELNSDKDFGRKSYRKEKFDYFRKSGNPWTETVNGTTYGHYGFYKYKDGQYIVEHLPTGMGITSVKTESKAKLLIKALDDNLPELPLNIKAFGDEYRCYGMTQEISVSIKNIINSANDPVVTEIQDGKVPFRTKAGLVDYVKTHIGDKVRVTFNNGASEVRTLESISNTSMRTKKPDGSDSVTDLKGIKYNDNGFSVEYGTGVSVTYDFINTDETHESATEPTESVIKKADSVTETPESEKITVDMDDETRAELLNKKSVNVVSVDAEHTKALDNIDLDALQNSYPSYARPIIKKIARDFGILNAPFYNSDIELEFSYSSGSIQESINKQHSRYGDFVKMLSVFSDVIENAVGIETHKDKYTGTRREDTNLKQMYVLASAFSDEKGIYPVKLEVKEFKKSTNKLYLSVVLTKKESRNLSGNLGQNQLNTAPPTSVISIADLISIVNPSEGDFLKYFPDSMLDSEQIESKNKALEKDAEKVKKLSEDKKRGLATAENADALSSTPETTNSTASNNVVSQDNDIINSSVRGDAKNDTHAADNAQSIRSSKDVSSADHTDRWSTERITSERSKSKNKVTLSDIVNRIRDNYNIPISTGKVTDREASGIYKENPEVIRTRIANNLPTISHELGHHLDKAYHFSELDSVDELCESVSKDFLERYPESERPGEAVAEFVRTYLRNTNEANRLCQDFYSDFIKALSKKDLKSLNEIADSVNEYLSYNVSDRYDAAIVSSKKKEKLPFRDKWHMWYSNWVDSFHPQKQVIDYVEDITGKSLSGKNNAYILATNSLNAHTVANFLICEGFRDLDGNIIDAKSFVDSIGMVDSKNVKLLDKYLVLRHSLEWIAPEQEDVAKKRVFADDTLEDVDNIKKQIAKIEKKHPEIKTAAKNLYEYQNNVLEHFVIPAGGMTDDTLRELNRMYPSYVPFYRAKGKKTGFAKGTFANQRSPIMRAKGSGEMIISPTESIIRNTEKMVKYALRNQVMQELANYADNVDGFGQFVEKVPPDMVPHTIDISGMKESFTDALQQVINSDKDYFAVSDLFEELFDDTVTDFTPVANANKRIVTVMRGGKPSYYQIHDEEFYKSVAELSPQQVSGLLKISQTIMQPMKILITQNNPIFAATNAIRDYGTAYKLSEINNPATFALKYIQALGGIVSNNDAYKQYKAMGGGHSSELSANIEDISKTLRRVAQKDMGKARRLVYAIFVHPVSTVAAINDAIESIPRFMEFQRTLESGGDLQQAIYNADDITTNFKKSGKGSAAKGVNKLFMFNNAAIQGLDKLFRTITAKVPKKRTKTIIKWVLNALIMGVIGWLWNKEVDEEGYENLSSYKKNNFYNFAIGDGKFISLPKPRENALLDTFTERTIEYLAGENKEAFYDFGNYLGSQLLPPMLPDTLDPIDAVHSVLGSTVMGGLVDIGFNQDFKGSPIESKYDEYLPSNERYTENTSKLAYTLGQTAPARAIDMSPKKIDHLISSYTGILGQVNKALSPMNDSRRDTSLGLRNKFISDSNYSTDVLNRMYENQEKAERAFNYSGSVGDAVEYENNNIITSYISGMNKAVKALPEEDQRTGRAYLLKSLNSWNYSNTASQKEMLRRLDDETISDRCVITGVPKSTIEWTKDKVKYSYQMTPQEYDEYVKDYLKLAEKYRTYQSKNNKNTADYTEALSKADTEVKKVLSKKYQQKYAGKAAKEAKK